MAFSEKNVFRVYSEGVMRAEYRGNLLAGLVGTFFDKISRFDRYSLYL